MLFVTRASICVEGYKREFLQLFGFEVDGVDYDADVNPDVAIAQMV